MFVPEPEVTLELKAPVQESHREKSSPSTMKPQSQQNTPTSINTHAITTSVAPTPSVLSPDTSNSTQTTNSQISEASRTSKHKRKHKHHDNVPHKKLKVAEILSNNSHAAPAPTELSATRFPTPTLPSEQPEMPATDHHRKHKHRHKHKQSPQIQEAAPSALPTPKVPVSADPILWHPGEQDNLINATQRLWYRKRA